MTTTFYLGRYNCIEPMGSGALGDTFRAKIYGVAGFEKQLAVKRIHAELCGDPAFIERFVKAASAASALGHDRIAAIHEVGAQGTLYYVAADLVRGIDLSQLADGLKERGEAITPDMAITVALDVLEALAYAHSRRDLGPNGVLHLGLGPRSVLLSPEGDAKLLDVGLFAALAVPGWATDARVATLAWVAPEVADGGAADSRADVFSVGALLHQLLSGLAPFAGVTAAELRQKMAAGPPAPPACEGRLQTAIARALAPDPAARFPSVEALSEGLRPMLTARASRARGDLAMLVRRLSAQTTAPAPPEPVLQDEPTKNTFAGVGPADAVPVQKTVLPGPATEKAMDSVAPPLSATGSMPLIPLEPERVETEKVDPARIPDEKIDPAKVPDEKTERAKVVVEKIGPEKPTLVGASLDLRPQAEPLPVLLPVLPRTERVTALPDPPPNRRGLVIGVAAALAALVGAGLWIQFGGAETPKKVEPPPPIITPSPASSVTISPPPSSPTLTASSPAPSSPMATPLPASPSVRRPVADHAVASSLSVTTTPAGALLFVDGEARGQAPLSVTLPAGTHRIVALAEHAKIYKESLRVDGPTPLAIKLEPAATKGPAGLKVRCKSKTKFRIFVDGTDSGLSCPNETRINVTPGEHTVGLYSPTSDRTVEVKATVKDDADHSTRVYLNY